LEEYTRGPGELTVADADIEVVELPRAEATGPISRSEVTAPIPRIDPSEDND
jgi:hypothetical protein